MAHHTFRFNTDETIPCSTVFGRCLCPTAKHEREDNAANRHTCCPISPSHPSSLTVDVLCVATGGQRHRLAGRWAPPESTEGGATLHPHLAGQRCHTPAAVMVPSHARDGGDIERVVSVKVRRSLVAMSPQRAGMSFPPEGQQEWPGWVTL